MKLIDKIILEWSYRTEKGYPDLDNEKDLAVFESMFDIKLTNGVEWPKEVLSRYGDITFKLDYAKSDRAKYEILDTETGKTWEQGGVLFGRVSELEAYADNYIKPSGGRQSSRF